MIISANSRVIKTESTLVQELTGEAVLLNLGDNQYYRLDENSLRMFNVIISSPDLADATTTLSAEFDVAEDQLWSDLLIFIEDLQRSGLVQVLDE